MHNAYKSMFENCRGVSAGQRDQKERKVLYARHLESEEVLLLGLEHGVEFLDELIGALLQIVLLNHQSEGWHGDIVSQGVQSAE